MEKYLSHNGNLIQRGANKLIYRNYTPGTVLPPYTIRLKFSDGVIPTFSKGTGTLVDSTNNIWDLTYENTDWTNLLINQSNLLEVIDGNTSGVVTMVGTFKGCRDLTSVCMLDTTVCTTMSNMFKLCGQLTSIPKFNTSSVIDMESMLSNCGKLTTVPLFDTSSVSNMKEMLTTCRRLTTVPLFDTSSVYTMEKMLYNCQVLTNVPLFDTSSVSNMKSMVEGCVKVQSGALALYQQASTQSSVPSHNYTFRNCGKNTTTGAAELAQIPSDWK